MSVPVGTALLGRVVNPLGTPIDVKVILIIQKYLKQNLSK